MRATLNGTVLAESQHTKVVEGNHYFPPESIRQEHFRSSNTHTVCFWKGVASYYTIIVEGAANDYELPDAAWHYPRPLPLARKIKKYVAFSSVVTIESVEEKVR